MTFSRECRIAVLALALCSLLVLGMPALAPKADGVEAPNNTPGGAQVGFISSGTVSRPTGARSVSIETTGSGPYTYTLRWAYANMVDPDPILTTSGTSSVGSSTYYGDVFGTNTVSAGSNRLRLWDVSADPAVLLLDETFGCPESPTIETSPDMRYLHVDQVCTVPGSGGNNVVRYIRILDLGAAQPLIYTRTITNVASGYGSFNWSGDFDEAMIEWGLADATQSRRAETIGLDSGTRHEWDTGAVAATSGVTQWMQGFSPCGTSFVTYDTAFTGPTTTGVTYTLRSTATGAVLGSVAMPKFDNPPDPVYFASLNQVAMNASGAVTGVYGGTTYTIGTDPERCDAHPVSPLPQWLTYVGGWHDVDFAGGRTLTWPTTATDDKTITGYEVWAMTSEQPQTWRRIARTSANVTSTVLPADLGTSMQYFRIIALDAEGRRSNGPDATNAFYIVQGTPGPVQTTTPTTAPPTTPTTAPPTTAPPTPTTAPPTPTTSPTTGPTTIPNSWITRWPTKIGKPKVGKKVAVSRPRFSAAGARQNLTVAYQWYAGGKSVKAANSRALRITKAMRGKRITVMVSIGKSGYAPRTRTLSFGKA